MDNLKNNVKTIRNRRAMTTENARRVKLAGHEAEMEFAELIGGQIYPGTRKKDVIDKQNNIHSVKSGEKKWQIFLYGRKRFQESIGFLGAPNFLKCIDTFPEKRENYKANKEKYKLDLQCSMRELKDFLIHKEEKVFLHDNKIIFLEEAIFHSSEVDYLTIKENIFFHIFDAGEVIKIINNSVTLINSKASQIGQMDDQKVIFKLVDKNITIGEIEMRNDSDIHYRKVKFWMDKEKTTQLLKEKIQPKKQKGKRVFAYGKAINKFKKIIK
ncbi:MAG: hypothetical protein ABIF17_04365 [Patescibacteria group bacterium]